MSFRLEKEKDWKNGSPHRRDWKQAGRGYKHGHTHRPPPMKLIRGPQVWTGTTRRGNWQRRQRHASGISKEGTTLISPPLPATLPAAKWWRGASTREGATLISKLRGGAMPELALRGPRSLYQRTFVGFRQGSGNQPRGPPELSREARKINSRSLHSLTIPSTHDPFTHYPIAHSRSLHSRNPFKP